MLGIIGLWVFRSARCDLQIVFFTRSLYVIVVT